MPDPKEVAAKEAASKKEQEKKKKEADNDDGFGGQLDKIVKTNSTG